MNLEDQLRHELTTAAELLPSPDIAIADLERVGRREQRRRGWTAVAGGAAVAVAVAAAVVIPRATSGDAPGPVHPSPTVSTSSYVGFEDLPVGNATGTPWWQAGVLHVDGVQIQTPFRQIVYRGGATVVGRSSSEGSEWYLVAAGKLQPLVSSDGPLTPVVSSDGSRIAWVEQVSDEQLTRYKHKVQYQIVLYDTASMSTIGELQRTADVVCCDASGSLQILGITLDGRVIVTSLGGSTFAWSPDSTPVSLTGVEGNLIEIDSWPGGVSWQGGRRSLFYLTSEFGTVDASGQITHVGTMPADQLGVWSADGTQYAYPGLADGTSPGKETLDDLWVRSTDSKQPVELQVPSTPLYSIVAWESADDVLIEARQPFGEHGAYPPGLVGLVRCSTTSGACERVPDGPTGNAVLPETS